MLKSIVKTSAEEIYLIIAVKDSARLCFKEEINQLCEENPKIKVHVFFSLDPELDPDWNTSWEYYLQRVDVQLLKSLLPFDKHLGFYICGPEKMMAQLIEGIAEWKGRKSQIYTESFGTDTNYNLDNDKSKVIQVHFQRSNRTVQWDHEFKNILEFAESNEIILDAGCMFGECGACSTKLISGTVEYNHETAAKPAKGNCLICSSRPSSDLVLDA